MNSGPLGSDRLNQKAKRKHVATGGKPPGGKRHGAGRPQGSKSPLALGEVKAVKGLRVRIPEGTPEAHAEAADEAFQRIVDVMRGRVFYKEAPSILKAATTVREEVCGPLAQKIQHEGSVTVNFVSAYTDEVKPEEQVDDLKLTTPEELSSLVPTPEEPDETPEPEGDDGA